MSAVTLFTIILILYLYHGSIHFPWQLLSQPQALLALPLVGRERDFMVLKSIMKYSSRGQGTFDPYFILEKASPFTPPIWALYIHHLFTSLNIYTVLLVSIPSIKGKLVVVSYSSTISTILFGERARQPCAISPFSIVSRILKRKRACFDGYIVRTITLLNGIGLGWMWVEFFFLIHFF